MATIILERPHEYNNLIRNYRIYLDDKKAGEISAGQTKTFDTEPGKHTIECKIDWCSSPVITIDIASGETKRLQVNGFKFGNWILPVVLLSFLLPSLSGIIPGAENLYYLYIPLGGLLIYYITLGRKKYLRLTIKS